MIPTHPIRKRLRRIRPEDRIRNEATHEVRRNLAPQDVIDRQQKLLNALEARTDVQRLLGDPPDGYSALANRRRSN